jgi:tetratricopeptide (TPR) repeat protein
MRCKTFALPVALLSLVFFACVSDRRAQEYYALGDAYFELGKYDEAETWYTKAKFNKTTKEAAYYSLGRVAFEKKDYKKAADYFDQVLYSDGENVMALKGAAYSYAQAGNAEKALSYYEKINALVPEDADSGYNYALFLSILGRNEEAESALSRYSLNLSGDNLLLLARLQKAQNKVEAVDTYAKYLETKDNDAARAEYAEAMENAELYARALMEYKSLKEKAADDGQKALYSFRIARCLFKANPEDPDAQVNLDEAVKLGFADKDALEKLELYRKGSAEVKQK